MKCEPHTSDPWDAFRPLALPTLISGWDRVTQPDRAVLTTCDGFGKAIKFRDIPTAPIARRYLSGLMELAEAYATEEAPFNLDRGGR